MLGVGTIVVVLVLMFDYLGELIVKAIERRDTPATETGEKDEATSGP